MLPIANFSAKFEGFFHGYHRGLVIVIVELERSGEINSSRNPCEGIGCRIRHSDCLPARIECCTALPKGHCVHATRQPISWKGWITRKLAYPTRLFLDEGNEAARRVWLDCRAFGECLRRLASRRGRPPKDFSKAKPCKSPARILLHQATKE